MPVSDLWKLTAHEIADGISQRRFSSTEVTRAFLQRIDAYDAHLRAFITVDAERTLAAANAADSRAATGALHGVPIAIKDNIDTAGIRTTGGSKVFADRVAEVDAPVVKRLKAQGAIVLAKTNLHEFAYGGTCTNVEFGAVRNPWNLDHDGAAAGGFLHGSESTAAPSGRCGATASPSAPAAFRRSARVYLARIPLDGS
jgi:Asp-tRNA(Asn)/Glu-tRNA(Gln) amidotransferase A subunit family amidase